MGLHAPVRQSLCTQQWRGASALDDSLHNSMPVLLVAGVSMLWCAFLMHGPAEETVEVQGDLITYDPQV